MTEPKSDCCGKGYTFINCTWDGNSPEWQGEKVGIFISNQCEHVDISHAIITKRHKPRKVKEGKDDQTSK